MPRKRRNRGKPASYGSEFPSLPGSNAPDVVLPAAQPSSTSGTSRSSNPHSSTPSTAALTGVPPVTPALELNNQTPGACPGSVAESNEHLARQRAPTHEAATLDDFEDGELAEDVPVTAVAIKITADDLAAILGDELTVSTKNRLEDRSGPSAKRARNDGARSRRGAPPTLMDDKYKSLVSFQKANPGGMKGLHELMNMATQKNTDKGKGKDQEVLPTHADSAMSGIETLMHNPKNQPPAIADQLYKEEIVPTILSRTHTPIDVRVMLEFLPRAPKGTGGLSNDIVITYGSLFGQQDVNNNHRVEIRLLIDAHGINPMLKIRFKGPGISVDKHVGMGFTANCVRNLVIKQEAVQDWDRRPLSVKPDQVDQFYASLREGHYTSVSFTYVPDDEMPVELSNILTEHEYRDNKLLQRLMKSLREALDGNEPISMRFVTYQPDRYRLDEAVRLLKINFKAELTRWNFKAPSYLRHFYKNHRCWAKDIRPVGGHPIVIKETVKPSCSTRREMCTRAIAGIQAQEAAECQIAAEMWEQWAEMRCIGYPGTRFTVYQALVEFQGKPPRLPASTRVKVLFGEALEDDVFQAKYAEEDDDEVENIKAKGWPGTVLTSAIWQGPGTVMITMIRPRINKKLSRQALEAYFPNAGDENTAAEALFNKAPRVVAKILTLISHKAHRRIIRAIGIMLDGGRNESLLSSQNDEVENWFRGQSRPSTELPPDMLVNYQRAERRGPYSDNQFVAFWGSILLMRDTRFPKRKDLLKKLGREFLSTYTDADQADVVAFLSKAPPLSVVQGYPGTGKTRLLSQILRAISMVRMSKARRTPIVVVAPSNAAVDVIIDRLESSRDSRDNDLFYTRAHSVSTEKDYLMKAQFILEGSHQGDALIDDDACESDCIGLAELMDQRNEELRLIKIQTGKYRVAIRDPRFVKHYSSLSYLALRIAGYEGFPRCKYTNRDTFQAFRDGIAARARKQDLSEEAEQAYQFQKKLILDYAVRVSAVVVTTVSNMASSFLIRNLGDSAKLCFADEAGLITVAELMILTAHYSFKNIVLLGDPHQLVPINKAIRSSTDDDTAAGPNQAQAKAKTFPDVCAAEACRSSIQYALDASVSSRILYTQRRAIAGLMRLASNLCYNGRIKDHPTLSDPSLHPAFRMAARVVKSVFGLDDKTELPPALVVQVIGFEEKDSTGSKFNKANLVVGINIVRALLVVEHIHEEHLAIICTYRAQVVSYKRAIRQFMRQNLGQPGLPDLNKVEIDTADSFQGSERKVIVLDLVATEELGFLKFTNRLNVAMTRGTDMMIMLGRSDSLREKDLAKSPVYSVLQDGSQGYPQLLVADGHLLAQQGTDLETHVKEDYEKRKQSARESFGLPMTM